MKIGLIAGGGKLPYHVVEGARAAGYALHVIAISGHAIPQDFTPEAQSFTIGEFGKISKALKKAKCSHICFAGYVDRPDFRSLKPDFKGMLRLPGVIKAARSGDNSLLAYMLRLFEREGFDIISPQEVCQHLLMPEGHIGAVRMLSAHKADAQKACEIATSIGALDIGQGAVVCRGLVLAVEAQEGTDAMLRRVRGLSKDLLGTETQRDGILAKMIKPGQDKRVDLPTLGVETVRLAAKAGLAGIVTEGGGAFVIDKPAVIKAADNAGLFIAGLPPDTSNAS